MVPLLLSLLILRPCPSFVKWRNVPKIYISNGWIEKNGISSSKRTTDFSCIRKGTLAIFPNSRKTLMIGLRTALVRKSATQINWRWQIDWFIGKLFILFDPRSLLPLPETCSILFHVHVLVLLHPLPCPALPWLIKSY